jgi:RHS repeat-associated protein
LFALSSRDARASATNKNGTLHEPRTRTKYAYDNDGRRSSATGTFARTGLPLAMNTTAYNANNQLTTWGTANLFYDLNGNMTSDGTHGYTWDACNRLNQIDSGNTATFSYDSLGRRVSKTILSTQTGFLFDRANAVQELSGTTVTGNSLSGGVDEVFQRTDSAGARSFLTDALGSTLALTDSSGTTQTQYTFEPFGNTTSTGSASTNSFAYTGRELDATGLYYYRARYYNPGLQRFVSEDPIRFRGGLNFYPYVFNSPPNGTDPFGRATVNLGGSLGLNFGSLHFQFGAGFVVDTNGNIGTYYMGGIGSAVVGTPIGASFGLTGGASSGKNICSFGGPFVEVGGNAGLGPSGGASGYSGFDTDGTPILGGSVSVGGGADASAYVDATVTTVVPISRRKGLNGCHAFE